MYLQPGLSLTLGLLVVPLVCRNRATSSGLGASTSSADPCFTWNPLLLGVTSTAKETSVCAPGVDTQVEFWGSTCGNAGCLSRLVGWRLTTRRGELEGGNGDMQVYGRLLCSGVAF